MEEREIKRKFDKSENDLKALQSVGQIVGEVLKQLTEEKCKKNFDFLILKKKFEKFKILNIRNNFEEF